MTSLRPWRRAVLLDIARELTICCEDPAAVAANALVLAEWAEHAPGRADQRIRIRVLDQQLAARWAQRRRMREPSPFMNDPAGFVRQAQVLYAFVIAGAEAGARSWP